MVGRLLYPANPAFDANGDAPSYARITVYDTQTTDLASIYADADETPLSNPHTVSAARLPEVWAALFAKYTLLVETSPDNLVWTEIYSQNDVSPQGELGNPATRTLPGATVLTAADLNATLLTSGTWPLTLPLGSDLTAGWRVGGVNGSGNITLTGSDSDLFTTGSATKVIGPGTPWEVEWNGTAWVAKFPGAGRHAVWIPAEAMLARVTNGPGPSVAETATNKINRRTLDFDASTIEYAQFRIRMPKSWDEGTVSFVSVWLHGSTTTNFKVSWGLQAVAISDGEDGDAAFGTAQYSNDTGGSTGYVYISPESAAITVAGSPATEDVVTFQVLRKADDATNDTLAVDASLIGCVVFISTDSGVD